MIEDIVIGADIGGTHITAALVDLNKKITLPGSSVRVKVDSHAPYSQIIATWSRAINQARQKYPIDKVSLAIPGPFDYENGICLIKDQNKYASLYGLNIKALLSEKLNIKPENITLINDATSFLQGEVFSGAARGFNTALGVTLGTGLGTCTYEDQVASDADLWNMPFKNGIAEDYLSTRWFTRRYLEITGDQISGVRELCTLTENTAEVKLIFEEFGRNLADFLVEFMSITLPEVVVIGGNIVKSFPFFKDPLVRGLNTRFPQIMIKPALLGEEAALLGAASYWQNKSISSTTDLFKRSHFDVTT